MDSLFILISRISVAIMILVVLTGLWKRKYFTKAIWIFLIYRIIALFFNFIEQAFIWCSINYLDLILPFLERFQIGSTSFLSIFFQWNNLFFLSWFYALLMPDRYGKWIKIIAGILLVTMTVNYLFIEGYHDYGVFNPNANAIFTFSLGFFYLWHLYRSELSLPLAKNTYFWFSIALAIPYLTSFILFLIGDVSHEENYPLFVTMSLMKNGLFMVGQIFMIIGFLQSKYAKYILLPGKNSET